MKDAENASGATIRLLQNINLLLFPFQLEHPSGLLGQMHIQPERLVDKSANFLRLPSPW